MLINKFGPILTTLESSLQESLNNADHAVQKINIMSNTSHIKNRHRKQILQCINANIKK